jgi:hypothetical protein
VIAYQTYSLLLHKSQGCLPINNMRMPPYRNLSWNVFSTSDIMRGLVAGVSFEVKLTSKMHMMSPSWTKFNSLVDM